MSQQVRTHICQNMPAFWSPNHATMSAFMHGQTKG